MTKLSKHAGEFWKEYSKKQLSPSSLMNLETDQSLSEGKFKAEVEHFNSVVNLTNDEVILDLGGGIGLWSEYFAQQAKKVILVEKEKEFVEAARQRFSENAINNIEVVHADVVNFDAEPHSINKVFISGVTIYLDDTELAILAKKIAVALKAGGELIHRDSYGRSGRYVIDNKFSEKLGLI